MGGKTKPFFWTQRVSFKNRPQTESGKAGRKLRHLVSLCTDDRSRTAKCHRADCRQNQKRSPMFVGWVDVGSGMMVLILCVAHTSWWCTSSQKMKTTYWTATAKLLLRSTFYTEWMLWGFSFHYILLTELAWNHVFHSEKRGKTWWTLFFITLVRLGCKVKIFRWLWGDANFKHSNADQKTPHPTPEAWTHAGSLCGSRFHVVQVLSIGGDWQTKRPAPFNPWPYR